TVGAYALRQLLFTGGMAEVGRRPAHIVDITLEIRLPDHPGSLLQDRFVAPGLDHPPLMEGQGAETAAAKTAAVADQAEAHFLDGRNAACLRIGRMPGAHI